MLAQSLSYLYPLKSHLGYSHKTHRH
ncbi:hypothetical protein NITGR_590059 [Nitrospina gracilis 3/211]|uniref:Uncharacterized protein n=1 Tax=Nitrospina gracilis (strain 3/211) TaxID=1266370 RepID=M1Z0F4_NITG3|nr:hypothetical protein NITGR_590059 [Nitrospina gracilis 3/211]